MKNSKKIHSLTFLGMATMSLIALTKIFPTTSFAGYSVFLGIVFFFIVEHFEIKHNNWKSAFSFKTFFNDIQKTGVLPLVFIPIITGILTLLIGDFIFKGEFSKNIISRTNSMLSFDKLYILLIQIIVAAIGEEIAWRGFFVGKGMKIFPFWLCLLGSSILFAFAHVSAGNFWVVSYDVITICVNAVIYAYIFKKSNNCLVSATAHILCNISGLIALFMLM